MEKAIAREFEGTSPYPECMSVCDASVARRFFVEYLEELGNYSLVANRITDKNTGNFLRIGFIRTLFPRARIIHCKRDALDTCTSAFFVNFVSGNSYSFDLVDLGRYYLDYERLMAHWRSLFPSEILDVQYEELLADQEIVSRQLVEHLGLEWEETCLEFHRNNRPVRTASNVQVRKPIYTSSIDRWKRYEKHLVPLISILRGGT